MAKCSDSACRYNSGGSCSRSPGKNKTYDRLVEDQWISLRARQEERKRGGMQPRKMCANDCINNIGGGCYLPSEAMVLSILTDEQWDELMR